MKTSILSVLLILGCLFSTATAWERSYTSISWGPAYSITPTSDGGYIVAGHCRYNPASHPDSSVYVFKINAIGDVIWAQAYGKGSANSIICTPDGGYIVAGWTCSAALGDTEAYVLKLNATGDTLWTRTYGGTGQDVARSIILASGGYIVAGYTNSFGAGNTDVWILKLNTSGDTLWTRTYGGTSIDRANSIVRSLDGGYILAGYTESFGIGWGDVWILKLNTNGDTLWTRTYGGDWADEANNIALTPDTGYVVAGYTNSFGAGYDDAWILRLNESGDTLWTRTYGGTLGDGASGVVRTADDKYYVAGYTFSFASGHSDFWILKLSAFGDSLWARSYGWAETWEKAKSIATTPDGGVIVAGYRTYSADTGLGNESYVVKLDSLNALSVDPSTIGPSSVGDLTAFIRADRLDLRITLPNTERVRLDLVNLGGEIVAPIADQTLPAGESRLDVPCPDLPNGVYLVHSNGMLPTASVVVIR